MTILKSIAAVVVGFLTVVVLSLGTDQLLHVLNVYPPWGQPMPDTGDNLLAVAYRCVYTVAGGFVCAWLAPSNPMRHVWVLAFIGLAAGTAGAVVTIPLKLGPAWFPIAIAITGPICTWFGGVLHGRKSAAPAGAPAA